jgi:hypothetical protein
MVSEVSVHGPFLLHLDLLLGRASWWEGCGEAKLLTLWRSRRRRREERVTEREKEREENLSSQQKADKSI